MKFLLEVKSPRKLERPYIYDTLAGTLHGDFFRERPPTGLPPRNPKLEIVLGFDCNGTCSYCDQAEIRRAYGVFPRPDAAYTARFSRKLQELLDRDMPSDCLDGVFWGGEGLLYFEHIMAIHAAFKGFRKTRWTVPTNGRLLRGEIFRRILKEPDIAAQVSHDGEDTLAHRGYDPFEDKEVLQNLQALNGEGRLIVSPVLHGKTVSRETAARYVEKKLGGPCRFGDMKFVYPANDAIYNRFAISEENLAKFRKREFALLFKDANYVKRDFIRVIAENAARSLNRPFSLGFHRDMDMARHLVVHLDGSLVWAHSMHPAQFLGDEPCRYGSLWNLDKKPGVPPRFVEKFFAERCAACPCLAFGDRGCVCMPQYGEKYADYYCETQRARLLPVFARLFFDLTEAFITEIKPLPESYDVRFSPAKP